jgi:hypothetical protein
MKNKTEICVPIRNEEELQQAKEILLRNGGKLDKHLFRITALIDNFLKYSISDNDWYLSNNAWYLGDERTEIPLSELESVLKDESVEEQSSIEWIKSEIENAPFHYRSVIDFYEDVMKVLEQAKQMHREEIELAYRIAIHDSYNFDINKDDDEQIDFYSSKYYNETFKND